ncbi:MAG TPA: hypothetical protein VG604_04270, partial [Candidatus Saccharimonadales bacterium]|nr:hypothetical protein [Candidatus Saccharimonadales bacterium]
LSGALAAGCSLSPHELAPPEPASTVGSSLSAEPTVAPTLVACDYGLDRFGDTVTKHDRKKDFWEATSHIGSITLQYKRDCSVNFEDKDGNPIGEADCNGPSFVFEPPVTKNETLRHAAKQIFWRINGAQLCGDHETVPIGTITDINP